MTSSKPRSRNTGLNRLSAVFVRQTRAPGVYLDGGGLRFQVTRSGGGAALVHAHDGQRQGP